MLDFLGETQPLLIEGTGREVFIFCSPNYISSPSIPELPIFKVLKLSHIFHY